MVGLIVADVIPVVTQLGTCDIELCFGDIAKLPVEEKVDVVVVSAFRGNYRATPTSLIGALKRSLDLGVGKLSLNKEEDLREIHHCWWTPVLPKHLPFKRLMCFEAKHVGFSRPQELVGDVFRCLIPILNNQDGSVITPLLNTGDQGYSKKKMMNGMVEAAVNWMKAGLPLRKLKIVLYAANVDDKQALLEKNKGICELFKELKETHGMKELVQKNIPIEYDAYISFSKEDEMLAATIKQNLELAKPDIRIFENQQEINKEEVWQGDMYEVMIRCARVITVLTPQYLRSVSCMEQYNMALCCNRTAERDILAPFYVEPIEVMPTYMGLVQYVDCLVKDTDKIYAACKQLSSTLDVKVHAEVAYERPKLEYDVFISYCHRNSNKAAEVMETVKALDPNLKVFFDTEELKTGATWQQMLYHAIDGTKCFVAVVTKDYLKSPVCQEEFNLSLSKHCQQNDNLILVPLLVDDLEDVPLEFKQIQLVNATGEFFTSAIQSTSTAILKHLKGKQTKMQSIFTKPKTSPNILETQERLRRARLTDRYPLQANWRDKIFPPDLESYYVKERDQAQDEDIGGQSDKKNEEDANNDELAGQKDDIKEDKDVNLKTGDEEINNEKDLIKFDIVISCTEQDLKFARFFKKMLKIFAPNITISCNEGSDQEKRAVLENASKVVAFVSSSYTESHSHMEELNIALCRHRFSPQPILFAIQLHVLPKFPSYVHLIPYRFCVIDELWKQIVKKVDWQGARTHTLILATRKLFEYSKRVSVEAAISLTVAVGDLIQEFKKTSKSLEPICPRSVLGNFARLDAEANALQKAPVDEPELSQMLYTIKLPKKAEIKAKKPEKLEKQFVKRNDGNVINSQNSTEEHTTEVNSQETRKKYSCNAL
ncbi:uncharacterized protein LOC117109994 [Anneissia japonica]|uniref:uncharacterized protein LOC117109994 n=1 Tax=Anneissia japonica TaxID=1529436 RepID=UPI001425AC6A|nr:uncharacterized protein LOC117109994 [Anneissia japonica]